MNKTKRKQKLKKKKHQQELGKAYLRRKRSEELLLKLYTNVANEKKHRPSADGSGSYPNTPVILNLIQDLN